MSPPPPTPPPKGQTIKHKRRTPLRKGDDKNHEAERIEHATFIVSPGTENLENRGVGQQRGPDHHSRVCVRGRVVLVSECLVASPGKAKQSVS